MSKVAFKIALHHNQTQESEGKLISHPDFPGVDFIIHLPAHLKNSKYKGYKITHFASGMSVTNGHDTQKAAIAQFLDLAPSASKRKGISVEEAVKLMRGQLDAAPIINRRGVA